MNQTFKCLVEFGKKITSAYSSLKKKKLELKNDINISTQIIEDLKICKNIIESQLSESILEITLECENYKNNFLSLVIEKNKLKFEFAENQIIIYEENNMLKRALEELREISTSYMEICDNITPTTPRFKCLNYRFPKLFLLGGYP